MAQSGEQREDVRGHMLPGIAGICMFLMFMTLINVYGALKGAFGGGAGRTGILAVCTLVAVGIFGLLRLARWGWALVLAGCLMLMFGDFYFYTKSHVVFFLIRGCFALVFFLYLVRTEVRDRLR